ncbi:MAG: uridine phosphorylase [Clostridia bacterium]|nr:uridine phosphorylase [Clostridia bacterium]MBQ1963209.1 uridine phosphorylase [Clostridia bacterium]MBQ5834018.1 uridine phosphorylase [Clostridia bacterium]
MLKTDQLQFHVPVAPGDIGKWCILPGDPGRCEKIVRHLQNPVHVGQNREFNVWNGELDGETVTVCSTGIGGPSTAIAVEELAACGAHTFIRVGTCGGISLDVQSGDVVIASGAVRQDGTSAEYAPAEFPAVSDPQVLFALMQAAKQEGLRAHAGVVQSKDAFYGQHRPENMPTSAALTEKWEAWKRLGVLASEMEASTLFTVGAARGLHTGAVFHVIWNQERAKAGLDTDAQEDHDTEKAIRTAISAIRLLIREA